jgi:hypothetical protein
MFTSKLFSATNLVKAHPKINVPRKFTSKPLVEEGQEPPKDLKQDTIFGKIIRKEIKGNLIINYLLKDQLISFTRTINV